MKTPYPKHRENIRVTDQSSGNETIYIVVDEETDRYYRFAPLEFMLFWGLDGQTPLENIKETAEKKFDVEIPLEQLEKFVEDLKTKELLEGVERKAKKRNVWGELFYLRFKAFNPERLLNALVSPLSFAFKPKFVIPSLALIAWSLVYSFSQRRLWSLEGRELFHGWGLLLLYVSFMAVGFVHEMGHALTCKFYGGRVKEIGFMLIYFTPAFYANVSDAYLFREKRHRAYVGAAGLFFQFICTALALMVFTFAIPGSLLSGFILGMVATSGFTAFWNFNPLIKLDGYYVISDLLEITNLRASSFRYIGLLLQRWFFNLPDAKTQIQNTSPRLKKIYLWYGILGFLYTLFFLGFAILFLFKLLVRKLAAFGLLLVVGGISWGIWNWYKHAAPGLAGFIARVKENPELRLTALARLRTIAFLGLALLILLLIPTRWGIKGTCEVHPAVKRILAPLEPGVVSQILKQSGETIRRGEVFATLDNFNVRRELDGLRIEKQLKEARLALLKADYGASLSAAQGNFSQSELALQAHGLLSPHKLEETRNAMEAAKARYEKSKTNLRIAKSEWERYQVLAKEELVSPKEAEEKQSAYESARQEFLAAQQEYTASGEAYQRISKEIGFTEPRKLRQDFDLSKKNLFYTKDKSAEIQAARSELDGVNSRIRTNQERLSRLQIRSPIDGIVMTPRVKELEGKLVGQGQQIAWVYAPGPMIFEIHMDELNISEVPKPNETPNDVSLKMVALPGQSFRGKVTRIIPESMANIAGKQYLVDVSVEDREGTLLPGMQGTAKIYGKWHSFLWQIFRRPVKYVFWKLWSLF